ncbi:hypothetical protein [Kitasatospora camelliae]|uniref:Lipoprotein n=1 Tax=Kitasatospora camelliae TaxID=3156397 RepID=A0AAU8JYE0_9ACTN
MRTLHTLSAAAVSVVLTLGLAACSGGGPDGPPAAPTAAGSGSAPAASPSAPPAPNPAEVLKGSAAVMAKAGSAKFTVEGGLETGSGVMVWQAPQALQFDSRSGAPEGRYRVVDGATYLGVKESEKAAFKGRGWLKFDQKAADDKVPGAGDGILVGGRFLARNPVAELTAAAEGGQPALVGPDPVDGAPAVHYRAALEVAALLNAQPELTADLRGRVLTDLGKDGTGVVLDFWINDKGELLRLKETRPAAAVGSPSGRPTTFTYTGLGAGGVEAPAASDVTDMAKLLGG